MLPLPPRPPIANRTEVGAFRMAVDAVAVGARFGTITAKGEDWQREKPGGDPLGVFLASSLKVRAAIPIASINPGYPLN